MVKLAIQIGNQQQSELKISEKDIVVCKIKNSISQKRTDYLLIEDVEIQCVKFFQNQSQKFEDIIYCKTNFDLTEENTIEPLFYPYYQQIYLIRKLQINLNQNTGEIKEEKQNQEYHMLFYFKEQKFCQKFFMELNHLELHPCQYLTLFKCECAIFYNDFKNAELFLIDCFELPTCLSCLYLIESEVSHLSIPKQEKEHTCSLSIIQQQDLKCNICNIQKDIWICLLCGYMFCGRYQKSHGVQHYSKTQHRFSIDIQKSFIWDYIEDRYVQKLQGEYSKYDNEEIFNNITSLIVQQQQQSVQNDQTQEEQTFQQQCKQQLQSVIEIQLEQQKQYYLKKEEQQYKQDEVEIQRLEEQIKEKENMICWFQDVVEQKKNYLQELDNKIENLDKQYEQKQLDFEEVLQKGTRKKEKYLQSSSKTKRI